MMDREIKLIEMRLCFDERGEKRQKTTGTPLSTITSVHLDYFFYNYKGSQEYNDALAKLGTRAKTKRGFLFVWTVLAIAGIYNHRPKPGENLRQYLSTPNHTARIRELLPLKLQDEWKGRIRLKSWREYTDHTIAQGNPLQVHITNQELQTNEHALAVYAKRHKIKGGNIDVVKEKGVFWPFLDPEHVEYMAGAT